VTSIGLTSPSTSGTASYPIVAAVTGAQKDLHDGTAVTATVIYRQLTNVLTVPAAAVTTSGGDPTVMVVGANGATKKTIVTGASSGGLIQVTSGLSEGDTVQYETVTFAGRSQAAAGGGTGFGRGAFAGRNSSGNSSNSGGN
jgi:macrolide-specific efflux system membrane fusion protein